MHPKRSSIRGKQIMLSVAVPPELRDQLTQLSKATRVPKAAYVREAIEDLLKKYAKRGK